jgi:hypothetical protein
MASKVFLACALGGGIGAFVALQMWPPLWWVGMIVGGLVGYLTYEFNEVRQAVSQAWREVSGWRPNRTWWKIFFHLFPTVIIGMPATLILPPFLLFLLLNGKWDPLMHSFLLVVFVTTSILWTLEETGSIMRGARTEFSVLSDWRESNVFRVYFWRMPRVVAKGAWRVVTKGPRWVVKGIAMIGRFLRYFFVLVHSEVRLLCGLDAAFGAAVGYYFGNAIVGAIAGGIFGVINYEVISRRWLKLVPAKTR